MVGVSAAAASLPSSLPQQLTQFYQHLSGRSEQLISLIQCSRTEGGVPALQFFGIFFSCVLSVVCKKNAHTEEIQTGL